MVKKFQQTRQVLEHAQKYILGRTLDLGAGLAKYKEVIKQKTSEYVAFDMKQGPNIDVVGDALNLPFPDESFDTIVSTQVLEHVEKPWVMVKEIHRVLKNGGSCILTAPFLEPYHADPADYFRYTVEGAKSLFRNEGFQIIESGSYGKPFSVLWSFFKFSCFNPFKKSKKGGRKILYFTSKLANFLDRFAKSEIIYGDIYIIAKK